MRPSGQPNPARRVAGVASTRACRPSPGHLSRLVSNRECRTWVGTRRRALHRPRTNCTADQSDNARGGLDDTKGSHRASDRLKDVERLSPEVQRCGLSSRFSLDRLRNCHPVRIDDLQYARVSDGCV